MYSSMQWVGGVDHCIVCVCGGGGVLYSLYSGHVLYSSVCTFRLFHLPVSIFLSLC